MTDYPIIFSASMVLALLDGRKTMTRRLAWQQMKLVCADKPSPWQRVRPGDRLWVRENFFAYGRWVGSKKAGKCTYQFLRCQKPGDNLIFSADFENGHPLPMGQFGSYDPAWHLRPNIFMPLEESRLTLTVTATKIERLQNIGPADAKAEGLEWVGRTWGVSGVASSWLAMPTEAFAALWKHIHGPESWDENPEVVALTFTVHKQNIDTLAKEAA